MCVEAPLSSAHALCSHRQREVWEGWSKTGATTDVKLAHSWAWTSHMLVSFLSMMLSSLMLINSLLLAQ